MTARVVGGGVDVRSGGAMLGLRLSGYGYGDALHDIRAAAPEARVNRIVYRRGPLRQWYANEPGGLEQSFILASPPTPRRNAPLTLAMLVTGDVRATLSHRENEVIFKAGGRSLVYRGLLAMDARGRTLAARVELHGHRLLLRIDDRGARYPLRIDPIIQTASTSDPYAQAVLADQPDLYFRLDEPAGPFASDSSGNGQDGTYEPGVSFGTSGALVSDPTDTAVTWSGGANAPTIAVTQSGATLPSGNAGRTVEFWWRLRNNCNAEPAVAYGGSGSNDLFEVALAACSGNNGTSVGLNLLTAGPSGQKFNWPLPANWADGSWHMFDLTYDGTTAIAYMDGQVVGESLVPTPLTTLTPGNGFSISDQQTNSCCSTDDIDEVAIYPGALSPARISAHWTAGASNAGPCAAAPTDPYGQSVVSDAPSAYLRLNDLVTNAEGRVAFDSSGHCTQAAPTNGAYMTGTSAQPNGALLTYLGGAVTWDGGANAPTTAVTQSGATLPSGNKPRTVEFWWRLRSNCNAEPTITYGGPGTNSEFEVGLSSCSGNNGTSSGLNLLTDGQSLNWPLPANWTDGSWHLFDVTYDGTTATGYMDGQVVGSFAVSAALTTAVPGDGLSVSDQQTNSCCSAEDIEEVAVYPTALSPARVDAHWSAGASTTGPCAAAPTDPYGKGIVSDAPLLYLRLGDLATAPTARVAFDSSGHCTAGAATNGALMTGTAAQPDGALPGYTGEAITWNGGANSPITAVTQSGASLPSGNDARTVEFWWRLRSNCNAEPTITYGGPGTNSEFEVGLSSCSGNNGTSSGLNLLTGGPNGQKFNWPLPTSWTDGNWHMFDVTYDGSTAIAYMDGQVVGSSPVPTALSTVTPGNGFSISDDQTNSCCSSDDIAEAAVYPSALSSQRLLAHWEAQFATPLGQSIIAGTAMQGGGGGIQGARAQACPRSGAACTVDSHPTTSSGHFHMLVPNDTYTVTVFPPAGSSSGQQTITNVTVPPNALTLTATFSPPGGLPTGATFASPPGGTPQQNVVPSVNWSNPSTLTISGCAGGFGVAYVRASNTSTGEVETRAVWLQETPTNSGTYAGDIPPLAPLHGLGAVSDSVACLGQSHLVPDGGPPGGGTPVLISGTGFSSGDEVRFGSSLAGSVTVLQDNLISAIAPPGTAGTAVSVGVVTPSGTTVPIGAFTYFDVTSLDTSAGPPTGGTTVTIRGHGFTNVQGVVFGLMPAASVTVVNPDEIQAQAPVGVGTVDVQVLNGFATSQATSSSFYTYQGGPPGTENINEGVGDSALYKLAAEISDISPPAGCDMSPVPDLCKLWDYANDALTSPTGPGPLGVILFGTATLGAVTACAFLPAVCVVGAAAGAFAYFVLHVRIDGFRIYIDPSGTVIDQAGNPISGATATLLGQPPGGGSFSPVDPNSGAIEPATNPETTDASGEFDWEALAGTYEVEGSAPGCHAPGNSSQANAVTAPFAIPPPAVGLLLTLQCPSSPPPARPAVTAVSPDNGPSGGGNTVDISGTGLTGATGVRFGTTPATEIEVLSPYALAAVAPAGSGTVDVTVTTASGTSATGNADEYAYVAPQAIQGGPAISGVGPSSGPLSGGTLVTITGSSLSGAFAVDFGGTPSTQVTDISSTQVQAVAPAAQFAGRVDIAVTTATGTSTPTAADIFTYGAPSPPAATSVTVTASPNAVIYGQTVTLSATVSPTDGGGAVAFSADGSVIGGCGAVPLALSGDSYDASCSTAQLPGGNHTMTAAYTGDASYAASSNSTSLSVDATPHPTPPPPSISGNSTEGQTLTESHGGWTSNPTSFTYQWQDCDASGNACSNIARATAQTYTLTPTDVGRTIRVQEAATNGFGTGAPVSSPQTDVVATNGHGPPVNSIPPVASGSATNGRTLATTIGAWSGAPPLVYSYQWQRCAPKCSNIARATTSTYKLTSTDIGAKVRAIVTATNSLGGNSGDSNEVGPVQPTPAQIAASIRKVLAPSGTAAKIGAILKAGGFTFPFTAPGPGKVTISWYEVPTGAHLARKGEPKPVLVARASARFTRTGRPKITVEVDGVGRRLLQGSRALKLTSMVTFTPVGGKRTSQRRTFVLRR